MAASELILAARTTNIDYNFDTDGRPHKLAHSHTNTHIHIYTHTHIALCRLGGVSKWQIYGIKLKKRRRKHPKASLAPEPTNCFGPMWIDALFCAATEIKQKSECVCIWVSHERVSFFQLHSDHSRSSFTRCLTISFCMLLKGFLLFPTYISSLVCSSKIWIISQFTSAKNGDIFVQHQQYNTKQQQQQ